MNIYIDGVKYQTPNFEPGINYLQTHTTDFGTNVSAALAAWRLDKRYGLGEPGPGFLNVTTSGTTGYPMRISHSRDTIEQVVESNIKMLGLDRKSRIMSLYSPRGIAFTVLSLYIAEKLGCDLYIESFKGLSYIDRVNQIRPTHTLILPNIWKILHHHQRWHHIDFSSCDTLITGSDFTPVGMLEELKQHGAQRVYNVYGSTEVPPMVLISEEENTYSGQSVPQGCDVQIINGELVCRWSTQDHWWISGDCVEGDMTRFVMNGRSKNMFKQDHLRVYPEQIEKAAVNAGAEMALCQQVNTHCVLYYTGDIQNLPDFIGSFSHVPRFRVHRVKDIKVDNNLKKIIRTQSFDDQAA